MESKCNDCSANKKRVQEQNDNEPVSYIVYEAAMARSEERHKQDMERCEKQNKRLWILLIIAWVVCFLIVGIFTYERLQYDYESEQVTIEGEQDGSGINIIGGGTIEYGAESKNHDN